jgi:hypothetical protein
MAVPLTAQKNDPMHFAQRNGIMDDDDKEQEECVPDTDPAVSTPTQVATRRSTCQRKTTTSQLKDTRARNDICWVCTRPFRYPYVVYLTIPCPLMKSRLHYTCIRTLPYQ